MKKSTAFYVMFLTEFIPSGRKLESFVQIETSHYKLLQLTTFMTLCSFSPKFIEPALFRKIILEVLIWLWFLQAETLFPTQRPVMRLKVL